MQRAVSGRHKNPLEPLKVTSALKSELLKLQFRQTEKPKSISPLDYTIIAALIKVLKNRWHDINEELPEPGEYVLVSFENEGLTLPDIGRYETEDDGIRAFYPGDDDASYASFWSICQRMDATARNIQERG